METKQPEHLETGRAGENLAVEHLQKSGYRITVRNWKCGRGEIDIIAWSPENILVFVEVKTRADNNFGGPERAMNKQKRAMLYRTAGRYMEFIGYDWEVRFDVIAVNFKNGRLIDLRHIEDAFFPGAL